MGPNITFTGANTTGPYTIIYQINEGSNLTTSTGLEDVGEVAAPTSTAGIFTYSLISITDGTQAVCENTLSGSVITTIKDLQATVSIENPIVCLNDLESKLTFNGTGGATPYNYTYNINTEGNVVERGF